MNIKEFENIRWGKNIQRESFRHFSCLNLIKNGPVLDVGCGDGWLLNALKSKSIICEGVDLSDVAVKKCLSQGLSVTTCNIDGTLPYKDNFFEYVVLLDVLEHNYNPEALLLEAKRVSKKYVIVSVPNFSSFPARIQVMFGKVPENNKLGKGHIFWFNHEALLNVIEKSKLSIIKKVSNTFWPFSKLFPYISRIFPGLFALSFVVLLKK